MPSILGIPDHGHPSSGGTPHLDLWTPADRVKLVGFLVSNPPSTPNTEREIVLRSDAIYWRVGGQTYAREWTPRSTGKTGVDQPGQLSAYMTPNVGLIYRVSSGSPLYRDTGGNIIQAFAPTDGEGAHYPVGSKIEFYVGVTQAGYLKLEAIAPNGVRDTMVPNRYMDGYLTAGAHFLPGDARAAFYASPPRGVYTVKATLYANSNLTGEKDVRYTTLRVT